MSTAVAPPAPRAGRRSGTPTSVLTLLAMAVPPALLLQRQEWIVPRTGLGAGLGLVTAVALVLFALLLFAGDAHPRVTHAGPVPTLLLLWAVALTWSYFAWSMFGLPRFALLSAVGYAQSLGEIVFVLGMMGAMSGAMRHRTLMRVLVVCGAIYGVLLLLGSISGTEIVESLRLPFLQAKQGLAGIENLRGGFLRPQGMAGHPLEAGAVMTILSPLGIALTRASDGRARLLWGAVTAAMIFGALSTLSRSSTVGLVAAVAVMALRWPLRSVLNVILGSVGLVLALAVAAPERVAAYTGLFSLSAGTDSSLMSRQVARQQALDTIAHHFWTGRGFSSHVALGGRVLDNQLLGFAVEQGIPVMVMFIVLLGFSAWYLLRVSPTLPVWEREVACGLAGSLAALLVCSSILDIFGFPQIRLLTFVLLAFVGPVVTAARPSTSPADPPHR